MTTTRLATVDRHGLRVPPRGLVLTTAAATFATLVVLRLRAMHPGLLYPDGYQYLLMAQGIGQHLTPVATLGHGGATVAPSADAAAKPLFPALVALGESFGLSPVGSARAVAGLAAAAIAPLVGLVTLRLGGSRAGALLAALLCLASPTLGFWLGFPGPDGLAAALALSATAALVAERSVLGGALAGLAVTARPEFLVVGLAAALAATATPHRRQEALTASTAALTTVAVVLGILRPPISPHTFSLLPAAAALALLGGAGLLLAERAPRRAYVGAAVTLALLAAALTTGSAWQSAAGRDWPLLVLAGAGLALGTQQRAALRIAVLLPVLGVAYWWKNPGSERYVAILFPALAVLAGLGLGRLRPVLLAAATAVVLVAAIVPSTPSVGRDEFATVAAGLDRAPAGPLVTAAPDAYGVLLPDRPVRVMRPGETGLVLVDGAARAYEKGFTVVGTLLERIPAGDGFLRADGHVDTAPALLYRGRVVPASPPAASRR